MAKKSTRRSKRPGDLPFNLHAHSTKKIIYVRFRHAGRAWDLSTGEREALAALPRAHQIYAAVISGTHATTKQPAPSEVTRDIEALASEWVESVKGIRIDPGTADIYFGYSRHWARHFGSLDGVTAPEAVAYVEQRLTKVLRGTVRKEISALRSFLRWCLRKKFIQAIPVIAEIPKGEDGVRVDADRKRTGKLLTRDRVAEILQALPEWSRKPSRSTGKHFVVRDFFIVLYETGLRPVTLSRLRTPRHFKGEDLWIEGAIDKVDYDRTVPLTDAAREALIRACAHAHKGMIFGLHDYHKALAKFAPDATEYDFRHSRATHLLESGGSLPGTAYLLGHRQVTTTNRYAKPSEAAARDALARVILPKDT